MEITVTSHAIDRYRERLFDFKSSDEKISFLIKNIVYNGKHVCSRPSDHNNCLEVKYKGISVVIIQEGKKTFVITCLGNTRYRKWIKQNYPSPIIKTKRGHNQPARSAPF